MNAAAHGQSYLCFDFYLLRPCLQCVKSLSLHRSSISLAAPALSEMRVDCTNPAIGSSGDDGKLLGAGFCDRD